MLKNINIKLNLFYIKILYNFTIWNKVYLLIMLLIINICCLIPECYGMESVESSISNIKEEYEFDIKILNAHNRANKILKNSSQYIIDELFLNNSIKITQKSLVQVLNISPNDLFVLINNPLNSFNDWVAFKSNYNNLVLMDSECQKLYLKILFKTAYNTIYIESNLNKIGFFYQKKFQLSEIQENYFSDMPPVHFENYKKICNYLLNKS
jgi:hypothetical protein